MEGLVKLSFYCFAAASISFALSAISYIELAVGRIRVRQSTLATPEGRTFTASTAEYLPGPSGAARNEVTFPIYTDEYQAATGAAYPIYNYPTHIFIGPDGIVSRVVLSEMNVEEAVGYARDAMSQA